MNKPVFPLRISSIERLQILDDHPAWPNWIGAVLHLEGMVDPAVAQKAVDTVLRRHALAGCRMQAHHRGGPGVWKPLAPDERPAFQILVGDLRQPDLPLPAQPAKGTEVGATAVGMVDQQQGCSRGYFLIHHALADGLGGLQIVRDWMIAYHNFATGLDGEHGLPDLDASSLLKRNRLGLLRWKWLRRLWLQPVALFGAWKFLFRSFAVLESGVRALQTRFPDPAWPRLRSIEIGGDLLVQARRSAKSIGVSLNDWLVGILFEALAAYRTQQNQGEADNWLRLIVPISLRTAEDRGLPAANRTSLVQLDRRQSDFFPRKRLMQGIARELGIIRRYGFDRALPIAVRIMSLSRWWLGRSASPRNRATSMLTNLGKPLMRTGLKRSPDGRLEFGGLKLRALDLVSPNKCGMPVSFAVHEDASRLRITATFNHAEISETDVQSLLEKMASRIGAGD